MLRLMRILAGFAVCALSASALLAQSTTAPVKVNPSAVVKKAGTPPPANATKGTSIGKGKATVNTANSASDTDSIWAEKIDIDGDGNVDEAQALWDDEDKVLYYAKDGTFTCMNGGTGTGGMIEVLKRLKASRKVLIHINNTNPILNEDSRERQALDAAGIEVAWDGMDIAL